MGQTESKPVNLEREQGNTHGLVIGILVLIVLVGSVISIACFPRSLFVNASAALPDVHGKIIILHTKYNITTSDSTFLISAVNPDGSDTQNLESGSFIGFGPVVSPDGTKIAFGSSRDGHTGLYVMNIDGSNVHKISSNAFGGTWSPDSTAIALLKDIPNGTTSQLDDISDIYVAKADGTSEVKVTDSDGLVQTYQWSPDSKKITFSLLHEVNYGYHYSNVFVANADGMGKINLTNHTGYNQFAGAPVWSPEGKRIVYVDTLGFGSPISSAIYVVNATDGKGRVNLTADIDHDYPGAPIWSPDGKKILFDLTHLQPSYSHILYVMNSTDGSDKVSLGHQTITVPQWSPDSKKIAFDSNEDGPHEIYAINADGTNFARLTSSSRDDIMNGILRWSPDSSEIVFSSNKDHLSDSLGNELYEIKANGGEATRLTSNDFAYSVINWIAESQSLPSAKQNGKILYTSYSSGKTEIYAINPDGSGLQQLTNNTSSNYGPRSSPDGSKIAFVSDRAGEDGAKDVFTMNADGSDVKKITDLPGLSQPSTQAWSPDGTKIAFNRFVALGVSGVSVVNSDGSNLTTLSAGVTKNSFLFWSPDSKGLVFSGQGVQYSINIDGTGLKRLPRQPMTLSPDGSKIAYYADGSIFLVDANGNGAPRKLAEGSGERWSPDSTKIAFVNRDLWKEGIYVINAADGTGLTRLTNNSTDKEYLWSPDSTKIAFDRGDPPNPEIYVINAADGTGLTRLTNNDVEDRLEDWGPLTTVGMHAVKVSAVDLSGKPVEGVWTEIRTASDGKIVKTGYTPLAFTANSETAYKVSVANYDGKAFQHWEDGSKINTRIVNLTSSDISMTATYDTGDSLRGLTPLTYSGTAEQQPDLTVIAKSLDGNETLSMYSIIDPQFTNSSGTTYKVYAGNYGNLTFDHWSNGNIERIRELTIDKPTTITAYYKIQ